MIWLFTDVNGIEADDNAEYLCEYVMKNHKQIDAYYVLTKNNKSEYERLKQNGFKLVEPKSKEFYDLIKKSDVLISSHRFVDIDRKYDYSNNKVVFVPHGITCENSSKYINGVKPISLLTSCSKMEYNNFLKKENGYLYLSSSNVKLTGFPRHDYLLRNVKYDNKKILINFTWRAWLNDRNIRNSEYINKLQELLYSPTLKEIAEKYGYEIYLQFHPRFKRDGYVKYISIPEHITMVSNKRYEDLLSEIDLLITDYSSIHCELAYVNKPTIYYQFDKSKFLSDKENHSYRKGWFDFETMGFGPVACDLNQLLKNLEDYLKNGCKSNEEYTNRMKNFFAYSDTNNCERVYNSIISIINNTTTNNNAATINTASNVAVTKKYNNQANKVKKLDNKSGIVSVEQMPFYGSVRYTHKIIKRR